MFMTASFSNLPCKLALMVPTQINVLMNAEFSLENMMIQRYLWKGKVYSRIYTYIIYLIHINRTIYIYIYMHLQKRKQIVGKEWMFKDSAELISLYQNLSINTNNKALVCSPSALEKYVKEHTLTRQWDSGSLDFGPWKRISL